MEPIWFLRQSKNQLRIKSHLADGLKPWSVSAHETQHTVRRRRLCTDTQQLTSVRNAAPRLPAGPAPCGWHKGHSAGLPGLRGEGDHITRGRTQPGRHHSEREVQVWALAEGVGSAREDAPCERAGLPRERRGGNPTWGRGRTEWGGQKEMQEAIRSGMGVTSR